jgi:hypothetical protein
MMGEAGASAENHPLFVNYKLINMFRVHLSREDNYDIQFIY